jgi:hypothetical protein
VFLQLLLLKYYLAVREKEISVAGMASAAFICLIATAMSLAEISSLGKWALALFSIAGLVFYISIAMPFKIKRRERS